ncbi:MAG: TfoX/Sxy family protein [Candidatus Marinimicrobia bacterium]|nr:TfoX/Sxy family protein [Candidatus Neomarinimicrobiota bacterium]
MAVSDDFLEYLSDQLSMWGEVTSRKMFGGAGLYRDGKMFALVSDDVAYLKVNETNKDKFLAAGSSPFQPYPDKPAMMSYYEIPPDILENPEELMSWAQESLLIQKTKK